MTHPLNLFLIETSSWVALLQNNMLNYLSRPIKPLKDLASNIMKGIQDNSVREDIKIMLVKLLVLFHSLPIDIKRI